MTAKHAAKLPSINTNGKRSVGRPTLYPQTPAARRKLIDAVIAYGEQGYSEVEIAHAIGVERVTMKMWANQNHENGVPEFITCFTRAMLASQAYYERAIRNDGIGHEKGQIHPSVWKHAVSCRFRADWGEDRQVFAASQGEGAKVQINYIMAPNASPPPVQLHSHHSDAMAIDVEGDES